MNTTTMLQFKGSTGAWATSSVHPTRGAEWTRLFYAHRIGGAIRPRSKSIILLAALVASVLAFTRTLESQSHSPQQSQEQVNVAGHLDLHGMPVKQILQQQRGEKAYLFLRRADKNAFAIVDVTTAAKPVLLDLNVLPEPTGGNVSLPPPGSALAIAFVPDRTSGSTAAALAPAAANLPTETVRLIDLSDPQHPNTLKTFEGVTSVAIDDSRKLIFLTNRGGLWIVSHREPTLPVCSIPEPVLDIYRCQ
jgi:hypothetical protein